MERDTLYAIGELSRRTGLTVKTIRFSSDKGIVPPTDRSPAGYRLYGVDALARLDLVRTLRDLGLDLATVRKVLDREASMAEVAEVHADALDVQIQTLRLRRAILRAVARRGPTTMDRRGPTTMEMDLMHRLATLCRAERRQLVSDFVDDVFGDLDDNPEFVSLMRSAVPELPDDPSPEQAEAWVELAELCQNADFRTALRRTAADQAREPSPQDVGALQDALDQALRERFDEAVSAGVLPAFTEDAPRAHSLGGLYGYAFEHADDGDLRRWLLARLQTPTDPYTERYWRLVATVNGWPASPTLAPVHTWFATAFRHGRWRRSQRPDAMRTRVLKFGLYADEQGLAQVGRLVGEAVGSRSARIVGETIVRTLPGSGLSTADVYDHLTQQWAVEHPAQSSGAREPVELRVRVVCSLRTWRAIRRKVIKTLCPKGVRSRTSAVFHGRLPERARGARSRTRQPLCDAIGAIARRRGPTRRSQPGRGSRRPA